jgi:hypothetical protein
VVPGILFSYGNVVSKQASKKVLAGSERMMWSTRPAFWSSVNVLVSSRVPTTIVLSDTIAVSFASFWPIAFRKAVRRRELGDASGFGLLTPPTETSPHTRSGCRAAKAKATGLPAEAAKTPTLSMRNASSSASSRSACSSMVRPLLSGVPRYPGRDGLRIRNPSP